MRTLTLIAALALLAPAAARAQDRDNFSWHGRLSPGQTLEVRGINGPIRAEPARGGEAEVTATKTARRSDTRSVQIKVVPSSDGVTICAVYPTPSGRPENECLPGGGGHMDVRDNDVQVAFEIRVPDGVKLVARTVNGSLDATDHRGDADVATVNGSVRVSTTGLARATTVNGAINAVVGRGDWTGDLRFTTVNGGIQVTLPSDVSANVEASNVNGGISSDFPVTVEGRFGPRKLHGTIGRGGRDLVLKTVNGEIELRKGS